MASASGAENVFPSTAPDGRGTEQSQDDEGKAEYDHARKGKFRFKSSSSKSTSRETRTDGKGAGREGNGLDDRPDKRHRHHRHRRRHRRYDGDSHYDTDASRHRYSKRRKKSTHHPHHHHSDDFMDSGEARNGGGPRTLSPSTAFRESLFDALGDDEGAAYWESVYGQPIHMYEKPSVPKGPNGELEQMSDEEYAAYVRARMWERSYEGMMEERERLRAERARQKAREEEEKKKQQRRYQYREDGDRERMQFEAAVEASLKRGAERRKMKAWKVAWEAYLRCWEEMNALVADSTLNSATEGPATGDGEGDRDDNDKLARETLNHNKRRDERHRFRNVIFWPVESGKRKDVSRNAVEEFMRHAPPPPPPPSPPFTTSQDGTLPEGDNHLHLLSTLKTERVRWHPDKIQHRYGVLGIDETVMRTVTEVFQIIDRMWNEERDRVK